MKKQIIYANLLLALACSVILPTAAFAQVKTWGLYQDYYEPPDVLVYNRNPLAMPSLPDTDIINIHGARHTLAVKAGGTVLAWGFNSYGQLGNGTTSVRNMTPGAVPNLTNVVAVSAGYDHSLALKSDGTVWAWGRNDSSQVGDGTIINKFTPVKVGVGVIGFSDIIAVDAGYHHNLALKSDGSVWAWGDNSQGQIGDGTNVRRSLPVRITLLSNDVLSVSAGASHSLALTKTGRVSVWGDSYHGQQGNGAAGADDVRTPTLNPNVSGVAQIEAGYAHNLALKTDGTVWAWGYNRQGQIGNGTWTPVGTDCLCFPTPVQSAITGVTAISAGNATHTLARKKDGSIWAWGLNVWGQIGNGTVDQNNDAQGRTTPVQSSVGTGNVIFGTGSERSYLSVPIVPTPTGTNVLVRLGDAYVRFTNVIFNDVKTTITAIDPTSTGMSAPAGLSIAAGNQAYNIRTTFTPGGNGVTVCINATNEFDPAEFNKLRLLHGLDGTALVDRTVSRNYQKREVCAAVSSISSSVSPFVLAKTLPSTAAQVSVSGRVLTTRGAGLRNARVRLTDSNGNTRTAISGVSGVYRFDEMAAGETYILEVTSKRYQFSAQVLNVTEEINNLDFRAQF